MMFNIFDAAGCYVRTVSCNPDELPHHLARGERGEETDAPPPPPPRVITYADQRAGAYPSIGDQLDALWKGGTALDAMRERVRQVKADIPKPLPPADKDPAP